MGRVKKIFFKTESFFSYLLLGDSMILSGIFYHILQGLPVNHAALFLPTDGVGQRALNKMLWMVRAKSHTL